MKSIKIVDLAKALNKIFKKSSKLKYTKLSKGENFMRD